MDKFINAKPKIRELVEQLFPVSAGSVPLLGNKGNRGMDVIDQVSNPQIVVSVNCFRFGVEQQGGAVNVRKRKRRRVEVDAALGHVSADVAESAYLARFGHAA